MSALRSDWFGVAVDLHGCPNRCQHCYLGKPPSRGLAVERLRGVVEQFRVCNRPLRVQTHFWEPDYSDDYRRLYDLQNELSDLPSLRAEHELLSVWRLARDPEYAPWAYSVGVRVCQISLFGLEQATDWGCGRRGAFRDVLTATERVLAAGIRPRWQWFLTTKILPDLPGLIRLTEELHLRERCKALGGPFTLFIHTPGPDGSARQIEHLRPTVDDLAQVPDWLQEQSERHVGSGLGEAEGALVERLSEEQLPIVTPESEVIAGPHLWFFVCGNLDVYPNVVGMNLVPAWRLGNLEHDGGASVLSAFERETTPGLQALRTVPVGELARRFGNSHSRRLYREEDLKSLWLARFLEETSL